ncbi:MAG: HAD family hydrolase [Oligoflexales bacterium]
MSKGSRDLKVEILIFDLDGTLVDSKTDIANAMNATLTSLGLTPAPISEIEKFVGVGVASMIPHKLGPTNSLVAKAIALYEDTYAASLVDFTRPYPGVTEVLEHFRAKPKIVLTNKATRFVNPILEGLGIRDHFSQAHGAQCLPYRKPDPRTIQDICTHHGVSVQDAVIIGDTEVDIATGKAAGCRTCAVSYGYGDLPKMRSMNPDLFVDDLREIIPVLK